MAHKLYLSGSTAILETLGNKITLPTFYLGVEDLGNRTGLHFFNSTNGRECVAYHILLEDTQNASGTVYASVSEIISAMGSACLGQVTVT